MSSRSARKPAYTAAGLESSFCFSDPQRFCDKLLADSLAAFFLTSQIFIMAHQQFESCIQACLQCAVVCNHCATSCLQEPHVHHMVRCIQLDLECAAISRASAELMSLGSSYAHQLCGICAAICEACATECEQHTDMDHCRECAEVCRRCADECRRMAA
jgi:hypothetical protein